ncbi:hypothetical protein oki169_12060 [Helicobacter pylori]|nr:hypothetical protein [Campylobacter jejuni]SQE24495.1 Uncharacterised protein [Campylobacter jejuni subsp. doylei]VTX75827.1 Uncharacterised protein [Campylobacter jejuni]
MSLFSMKEHDIYELVRELENGKSVWVEGEYGAEYKVNYEEGIYYIISISFFIDIFIISLIYVETCH